MDRMARLFEYAIFKSIILFIVFMNTKMALWGIYQIFPTVFYSKEANKRSIWLFITCLISFQESLTDRNNKMQNYSSSTGSALRVRYTANDFTLWFFYIFSLFMFFDPNNSSGKGYQKICIFPQGFVYLSLYNDRRWFDCLSRRYQSAIPYKISIFYSCS